LVCRACRRVAAGESLRPQDCRERRVRVRVEERPGARREAEGPRGLLARKRDERAQEGRDR
jgi:hypothetical protein